MTGPEARLARETLGLTREQLSAELSITPPAVRAWEEGRIRVPRHIATDLAWRAAVHERRGALQASGLPVCSWIEEFEKQPEPKDLVAKSNRLEQVVAHETACDVCRAREAFITDHFPPMPPAPRHGWLAVILPIAERILALPRWAQAPATGATFFVAYSLIKLVILLPALSRQGWSGLLTAAEGIVASAALGAIAGFIYDLYRRWRDARASPERKAALEILDRQVAELRANGVGGGAARDSYLRQRRAILRGKLTVADLQAGGDALPPRPPNERYS